MENAIFQKERKIALGGMRKRAEGEQRGMGRGPQKPPADPGPAEPFPVSPAPGRFCSSDRH